MKKLLVVCAMAMTLAAGKAELCWMMVTDSGVKVPMDQVSMLVAADDATTFSVVRTVGSGEAVSGVTSVSFVYENGSTSVDNIGGEEVGMMHDAVTSSLLVMGCGGRLYEVYDMTGALRLSGNIGGPSERIDVSTLGAGGYILRVGGNSLKFIKK